MIVANQAQSAWVKTATLLFAVTFLPLALAQAQDYDAVEKRLAKAVKKGEISLEQAAVMMESLHDSEEGYHEEGSQHEHIGHEIGEWIESVGQELKEAVEQKKLSEKDAFSKWDFFLEKEVAPKLKALVQEEELDEQAAKEIWNHFAKSRSDKNNQNSAQWEAIKQRIESAVEAGKMSREEASRAYEGMKKRMAEQKKTATGQESGKTNREELETVRQKLHAAVEAGKLTPEQAHGHMQAYLKKSGHQGDQGKGGSDIQSHFHNMGVDDETLGAIKRALEEHGVKPEQLGPTFRGILHLVHSFRHGQGEGGAELDARLKSYFTREVGLSEEQLEVVQSLAKRVAHNLKEQNNSENR